MSFAVRDEFNHDSIDTSYRSFNDNACAGNADIFPAVYREFDFDAPSDGMKMGLGFQIVVFFELDDLFRQ